MSIDENVTNEDIARHYNSAMDSVNLINQILSGVHDNHMNASMKRDALNRNVAHLEIMLNKTWWTTENLQPFRDAIETAKNV